MVVDSPPTALVGNDQGAARVHSACVCRAQQQYFAEYALAEEDSFSSASWIQTGAWNCAITRLCGQSCYGLVTRPNGKRDRQNRPSTVHRAREDRALHYVRATDGYQDHDWGRRCPNHLPAIDEDPARARRRSLPRASWSPAPPRQRLHPRLPWYRLQPAAALRRMAIQTSLGAEQVEVALTAQRDGTAGRRMGLDPVGRLYDIRR